MGLKMKKIKLKQLKNGKYIIKEKVLLWYEPMLSLGEFDDIWVCFKYLEDKYGGNVHVVEI